MFNKKSHEIMLEYTFYIATNPSLSKFYGNQGVPVKIGYTSGRNWGTRVEGLNGKLDEGATRYAEVRDSEYLLKENWRIPDGCLLYIRTLDAPTVIEQRISQEILEAGGKKIENHYTLKKKKAIRATELFILQDKTKFFNLKRGSPSWDSRNAFFGGGLQSHTGHCGLMEVKVPVDDLLKLITRKLAEEYKD